MPEAPGTQPGHENAALRPSASAGRTGPHPGLKRLGMDAEPAGSVLSGEISPIARVKPVHRARAITAG